jgi:hypothetical protein
MIFTTSKLEIHFGFTQARSIEIKKKIKISINNKKKLIFFKEEIFDP